MSDVKHTPGPWVARRALKPVDGEYDFAISARNGGAPVLAEAFGRAADTNGTNLPAEANARLIAAAPELLTALKQWADNPDGWSVDQVNAAQAIIRKATGSDTDRAIATASSKP